MRTTNITSEYRVAEIAKLSSPLGQLRRQAPYRPLHFREALVVAERQAASLRQATGSMEAYAFPLEHLTNSPHLNVSEVVGLPVSGVSRWSGRQWQISVAAGDALVRQRFTISHEFKHVLDHPRRDALSETQIERVADHFAACLLMPKRLVVRLWGRGIQDIELLAEQFEVSTAALRYRLHQLMLVEPARCQTGILPVVQVAQPAVRPSLATVSAPEWGSWK